MIHVTFSVRYPPNHGEAGYAVEFDLWAGYGTRSAVDAHLMICDLFSRSADKLRKG